jgi:hypothetical protein
VQNLLRDAEIRAGLHAATAFRQTSASDIAYLSRGVLDSARHLCKGAKALLAPFVEQIYLLSPFTELKPPAARLRAHDWWAKPTGAGLQTHPRFGHRWIFER